MDDEPLARRGLRRELERIPGIECTGESRSRDEAITAIVEQRPDLVLLDIQLGRFTGFEVIEQLGADAMPLTVFVTAYDQHAIRAFEVHAVDYVLKPVDPERLRDALTRAAHLQNLEQGASLGDRLERLLASNARKATTAAPVRAPDERIVVRDGDHGRLSFVNVADIDWIEAAGNFVHLHVGARSHLLRSTMTHMARRVGADAAAPGEPPRFVRIRRSALVNAQAITSIDPYGRGMFQLNLRNGAKLVSSRYHQGDLKKILRRE